MTTQRGFTLIELLVVIVIIAVLACLTVVAVMHALVWAPEAATRAEIQAIRAACEQHRVKRGDYPPSTLARLGARGLNDTNNGIEALTACVSRSGAILWERADAYANTDADSAERKVVDWYFGDLELREITDAWGRPLVYTHHVDYPSPATVVFVPGGERHAVRALRAASTGAYVHPGSFQLWSVGRDGIPGTADDIVDE